MSDQRPSRDLDKIIVRLPDGMRDRLTKIAKENKRSVNAEVVDRLEQSFSQEASQALETIQIALDTSGMPISWPEVLEHIGAFSKAGRLSVVSMHVKVITPQMVSSLLRESEAESVAKKYRRLLKKKV